MGVSCVSPCSLFQPAIFIIAKSVYCAVSLPVLHEGTLSGSAVLCYFTSSFSPSLSHHHPHHITLECENGALMVFAVSMEEFISREIVDLCAGGEEQTRTLLGTNTPHPIVLAQGRDC